MRISTNYSILSASALTLLSRIMCLPKHIPQTIPILGPCGAVPSISSVFILGLEQHCYSIWMTQKNVQVFANSWQYYYRLITHTCTHSQPLLNHLLHGSFFTCYYNLLIYDNSLISYFIALILPLMAL